MTPAPTLSSVLTQKTRGFRGVGAVSVGVPSIGVIIQQLQPRSQLMPTELDLAWGLNGDITADTELEVALTVVDIDNLPEIAAIRTNNAWQDVEIWRVASGSFTIPTKTLAHSDPRFFRPKAWNMREPGAAVRRMALVLLVFSSTSNISIIVQGTVRYTEILFERRFIGDNAYADIEGNDDDFDDDIGMNVF